MCYTKYMNEKQFNIVFAVVVFVGLLAVGILYAYADPGTSSAVCGISPQNLQCDLVSVNEYLCYDMADPSHSCRIRISQ